MTLFEFFVTAKVIGFWNTVKYLWNERKNKNGNKD
jgi:hypothetical protein